MITKTRIYEILEAATANDRASRFFDCFITFLILANLVALV